MATKQLFLLGALTLVTRVQCQVCTDPHCAETLCYQGPCDSFCNTGYGINYVTHTCGACVAGCSSACNSAGAGTCDRSCSSGYVYIPATGTTPGTCVLCAAHCAVLCTKGYTCPQGNCTKGYASKAHPSYPGYYLCSPCGPNCNGSCSEPGLCDGPCKTGYGVAPALNDPTKKACYPCATHCKSGCNGEGGYCCDAPGTCDPPSSWIQYPNNSSCHVCS